MPIVLADRVKELMNRRGLSPKQLVRPGLSPRTIARCRQRDVAIRERALSALAKALGVEQEVLTGAKRLPAPQTKADQPTSDLSVRLSADIGPYHRNAFSLVAMRYGVPYTRIVELAPLLFTLVAEQSLRERRDTLAAVKEAGERLSSLHERAAHLPYLATAPHNAWEWGLATEEESIAAKDIFAAIVASDPGLDDYWNDDEVINPFVATLRRMADEVGESVEVSTVDASGVWYDDLCRDDALALAGNDETLAGALLGGAIPIKDIPKDLLAAAKTVERVAWLQEYYQALPPDPFDDILGNVDLSSANVPNGDDAKEPRS
jgi:transcriptional regulator with XRE-family HTH domain